MSYEVEISVLSSEALQAAFEILSPDNMRDLNLVGSVRALEFIKDYHREFDTANKWKNLGLPTHGAGRRSSRFGNDVTEAWATGTITDEKASLVNNMPLLSHKITGGTITPKNSSALTIPMVPEAHGVKAGDYPNKLFIPKGKSYLAEVDDAGLLRVVYLLRKSVTQKPVEGALPEDDNLLDSFTENVLIALEEALNDT